MGLFRRNNPTPWLAWMSDVAGRLVAEHNIEPGRVRPSKRWASLWRDGDSPATAAEKLSESLTRPARGV